MALSLIERLDKCAGKTPDQIVSELNRKGWMCVLELDREQFEELIDTPIYFYNISIRCYELGNGSRPQAERTFRRISGTYEEFERGWWDNWWFIPVSEWSSGCETSLRT